LPYCYQSRGVQNPDWSNSAMSGLTASNLPVVRGVGEVTCTRNSRKRVVQHRYQHAASLQLSRPQTWKRKVKVAESAKDSKRKNVLFQPHEPTTILRSDAAQHYTITAEASAALSCTGLHSLPRSTTNKYQVSKFRLLMQIARL
jgi:hypothetical protein